MTGSVHHRQTGKFEQSTGQEPVETVPSSLSSPLRPLELCADAPTEVSACSLPDPVVMSVPIGTSLDGDDEDDDIGLDRRSKVKNLTIVRVRAKQQRLKQYVTSESDTIGQLSDDCPSELLERPASKSQSSDAIEELKATCVNQEEACEFRRHSIDQLLCVAKLSPPLGFHDLPEAENEPKLTETSAELDGEQIEEVTINATDKLSEGDSESSSTSRAVCTNSVSDGDQQSTTGNASELDELDSSLKSNGSQTLISDLASESKSTSSRPEVADRVADASIAIEPAPASQVRGRLTREKTFDHGNRHHVTAPLVHAKTLPEALNSPESEASSQVTEQSSKTESTSSLPLKETLDEGVEDETKGSGSSVYVTATEHSPKGDLSRERSSFETASPANVSLFSSPSSSGKRKSSSSDADCGPLPPELAIDSKITAKGSSANTRLHLLVSPPKQDGERRRSHDERSESSEDSSTRRGSDCWLGSPGSESLGSRILDHGEELDSEDGIGFGDVTPMCELYSSDPSTAFEATTVIENVPDLISISKEVTNRIVSAAITAASAQVAPQSAHVPTMSSHGEQEPETRANESRPDSFGSPCQDIVEANSLEEAAGEDDAESVIEKTISEEIELSEGSEQGEEKKGAKVKVEPDVEKREERGTIDDEDAGQRAESEKSTVTSSFPGDNPEVFTQLDMADLLLAGVAGFCHRSLSGELSTVSEVSEEISNQRSSQDVSISSVTSSTDSGSEKAGSDKMATLKRKRSDGHSRKKASDLDMEGYDDVKYCGSKSPSPEACKEKRTGQSLPSSDDEEHTSGSFVIDGQLESESHEPESISDESHRNSSAVERTTASIAGLSTEDSANVKQGEATDDVHEQDEVEEEEDEDDEDQESSPGSFRQLEESKDISPEKLQTETPPRDMVVALIEAEASQATERDLAKFSFSLGQQSSQELDDDSLSMTGATCSHTPSKEQFSADWETSTTYTPPAAAPKPPLLPKPAMYRLTQVPPGAPLRQGQGFPLRHSRLQQQQNVEASSSDSSACRKRELMQRRTKSLSKSPERQQFSSEQSNVYRLPCQLQRGYRFLPSSESTSSGLVHATDEEHCPQPFATMPTVRPAQPIYRRSSTMDDIMSMSSIEAPDQLERPSSAETDEESHLDMLKPKAEVAAEPRARGIIIASSSIHDDKGREDETKPVPWQTTSNSDIAGSSGSHRIVELEGRACSSEPGQARSTELNQRELGAERRKEDGKGSKQSEPSTRRMIYRKSAIEMYRKLVSNSLSDQERASAQRLVQISRNNGEFGFRIHGSRPVMISAIEPGTETLEMLLVRPAQEAELKLTSLGRVIVRKDVAISDSEVTLYKLGVRPRTLLWPSKTLVYVIDSKVPAKDHEGILLGMQEIEKNTCIVFKKRTRERNYVKIIYEDGCWSYVGRQKKVQELSLGKGCQRTGTVVHELMHALGVYHEHERFDRDSYIKIKWENIEKKQYEQFEMQTVDDAQLYGKEFDFMSTMLYDPYDFSKNDKATMVSLVKGKKLLRDSKKPAISPGDIQLLNDMYKCQPQISVEE
ncbi:Zinc metalloproteinase nas-8 [Halotydeus destructor]|nr:Zinc metalloproteinase nas-8 [Halotydeus destructor]